MESKNKEVTITIDGKQAKAPEGTILLTLARNLGIDIPTLCYHKEVSPFGACRLCSVEVTKHGRKRVVTSCNYPIEEGLIVETKSEKVKNVRKGVLSLLMARCPKSIKLKNLGKEYGLNEHGLWESNPDEDCILCGLCVRVCKELVGVSAINFANRGIDREITAPYHKFSDDCIGCGACAIVCPTGSKKIRIHTYANLPPLKGTRDEIFGVHTEIFSAKASKNKDNLVKNILLAGLTGGMFDSVILAQKDEKYSAKAITIDNAEELLKAKDAPFIRTKIISPLLDAIDQGKRKIAFVGLPCQVRAARKVQQTLQQEIPGLDITLIGLFCRHSFDPQLLSKEIKKILGIDINQAEDLMMVDDSFIVKMNSQDFSCSLNQLDKVIEAGCRYCNDFPSNFADLAIGSEGSIPGFYTVVVRTPKGASLVKMADLTKGKTEKEKIASYSEFKKKRAKDQIDPILKEVINQRTKRWTK